MHRLFLVTLLSLAIATATLAIACGDDDADTPDDTDDPTVAATASPDLDAAARAEALDLCPEETMEFCVQSWVETARTSLPWALCVNEDTGTWFQETPGGVPGERAEGVEIGDACSSDSSHDVVALQNYP